MTTKIFVPRVGGGTLILTVSPPPASTLPTLIVPAVFRSGEQQATYRSGEQQATHRNGEVQAGGR